MALIEIILGAARAAQILLVILTTALSSAAISNLPSGLLGATPINHFSLFTSLFTLLSLLFLITSQFLFIKKWDGYSTYITAAIVLELANWMFTFASWISLAQFGASSRCDHIVLCNIDKALLAFMFLSWVTWSASFAIIVRLKAVERRERKDSQEIEMRIKSVVEMQAQRREEEEENAPVPVEKQ